MRAFRRRPHLERDDLEALYEDGASAMPDEISRIGRAGTVSPGGVCCDPCVEMAAAGHRPVVLGPVHFGPVRSLLERFRRNAGVPASVGGEISGELAPVFAALDEVERELMRKRRETEESAARRLQKTEEEVAGILAEARQEAALAREDALRSGLLEADAEAAAIVRRATAEVETLRLRGAERLPGLVAEVLARAREAAG